MPIDKSQGNTAMDNRDQSFDEKARDRSRRGDRPSRFSGGGGGGVRDRSFDRKRGYNDRRVYVSNVPYEYKWQDLKDLLRKEVGEVAYVELFNDENDKPRGFGIVEFDTNELAKKAVQKMHRYELNGRKLVVKEDFNCERDRYGRPISGGNKDKKDDRSKRQNDSHSSGMISDALNKWGNTYGLSPQFLDSLGIQGPLISRVFVANLDYKVDQKKLKEVFKLAGRIINCELSIDKDGKSRGFATVEYDHPVEAVQAISMLNNQMLYDRRMFVRLDRAERPDMPVRLPEGLKGIGVGLGSNGQPLQDVARNLPSLSNNNVGGSDLNIPTPVPAPALAALGGTAALGVGANQLVDILPNAFGGNTAAALGSVLSGSGGGPDLSSLSNSAMNNPFASAMNNNAGFGANRGPVSVGNNALLGSGRNDYDSLGSSSLGGSLSNNFGNRILDRGPIRDDRIGKGIDDRMGLGSANNMNDMNGKDSIIIRNLPNVSWQQLKDKFSEAGDVKYAEVCNDTGLIRYSSVWDANRAITLFNRARWDGHSLDIRFY